MDQYGDQIRHVDLGVGNRCVCLAERIRAEFRGFSVGGWTRSRVGKRGGEDREYGSVEKKKRC